MPMSGTMSTEGSRRSALAGFRVPLGLDATGALVAPEDAVRSVPYQCPACADRLTYRAGPIISANFAHRGGTGCAPESALHAAAKHLVAETVRAWLSGSGQGPVVRRACGCGLVRDDPIKDLITDVTLEHRLRSGDRDLVADVALLDTAARARLLVEVLVHHAVDADKRTALAADSIPWIELDAQSIIAEPAVWQPRAADNVRALVCEACEKVLATRAEELRNIAAAADLPAAPAGYAVDVCGCYRCDRKTPLYYWPGMFDYARPPELVPASVQIRDSNVAGRRYYANTCAFCRALIGHHYVLEHMLEVLNFAPVNPALERFYRRRQAGDENAVPISRPGSDWRSPLP